MADWKVLTALHHGNQQRRQAICQSIRNQVEELRLASVFPMVKYEVARGRGQEYYLGLFMDASSRHGGFVPESRAKEILATVGVHNVIGLMSPEEANFLRGSASEGFSVPIHFERPSLDLENEDVEPSLSGADLSDFDEARPDPAAVAAYSKLMMWCSASGQGHLQQMRAASEALGIDLAKEGGAWGVLRRMVLLGHLEYEPCKDSRWCFLPPVLIEPDIETGFRILAGQRTPGLLTELDQNFELEEAPQRGGPSAVAVYSGDQAVCLASGQELIQVGCASRRLAQELPPLDTWIAMLPTWPETDFRRFETKVYDDCAGSFLAISSFSGPPGPGMYRFSCRIPPTEILAFRDKHQARWIGGDFYGLRFIARHRSGRVKAWYDPSQERLLVPVQDRWPMPYERALVLASGLLPHALSGPGGVKLLAYVGVTHSLASTLATKLSLDMETL